jgi:hypothetical protein
VGFFKRDAADQKPAKPERSPARIGSAIPASAESRLEALTADGSLFTSGLSVKEFALLGRLGPQPLAQVMGASVVRRGWQYLPALPPGEGFSTWVGHQRFSTLGRAYAPTAYGAALKNPFTEASLSQVRAYQWHTEVVCKLDVLSEAWNMARRRALDRLTEEALKIHADVVVGVHVRRSDQDLAARTIRARRAAQGPCSPPSRCRTTGACCTRTRSRLGCSPRRPWCSPHPRARLVCGESGHWPRTKSAAR